MSVVDEMPTFIRALHKFLGKWKTACLATVDEAAAPHAANIQYAHDRADDRLRLYFVSSPESAHSRHIAGNAVVAVTIYAHVRRPDHIHGLQIHGRCAVVAKPSAAWDDAWRVYSAKYPFVKVPPLRNRFMAESFYCVTPTWVRFIDNRRGFGFKQECTFENTGSGSGALDSQTAVIESDHEANTGEDLRSA